MKAYHLNFIAILLSINLLGSPIAHARSLKQEAAHEARIASQDFVQQVNEARVTLDLRKIEITKQKINMAINLLSIIEKGTASQRRLARVEFGGGVYSDDLKPKKEYVPIESETLEDFTRSAGPRWVKITRSESDAVMVYIIVSPLPDSKTKIYLEDALSALEAGNYKEAQTNLADMVDKTIKVDDEVPAAIQARDYITLASNYMSVNNFFGTRRSMERAGEMLTKMRDDDKYKTYRADIISLHTAVEKFQQKLAALDAIEIKSAHENFVKWQQQISTWLSE